MKRIKEFDGLRGGGAALAVALFHLTSPLQLPVSFWFGKYGVDIFFMLSGFVIFQSLNSHDSFLDFLKSRFIRLFPIFWICVLASSLGIFLLHYGDKELSPTMVLANLTMIPKQFLGVSSYIEGSYWTLEHELFFYIFAGLSCFKFGWKCTFFIYVSIVILCQTPGTWYPPTQEVNLLFKESY